MRKLHVGFMKDLCNYDFDRLYKLVTQLVEDEQIEDLDIQANLKRAKSHQKKFHKAFANRERSQYTTANEELIQQRTQCLIMLRNRMKSYLPSFIPQERTAAKRINFVMREYGKKYYVRSITRQADLIDDLNDHINKKAVYKEAFTTLGLNGLMNQINELTCEIDQNQKRYTSECTQIKIDNEGVRKAAYADFKIMIQGVMYKFHICQEDQDKREKLEVLINKIYFTLQPFSTLLKSRRTKRANERAAAKRAKETALETPPTEVQEALPMGDGTSASLSEPPMSQRMGYASTNSESIESAGVSLQLELETQHAADSVDSICTVKGVSTSLNARHIKDRIPSVENNYDDTCKKECNGGAKTSFFLGGCVGGCDK